MALPGAHVPGDDFELLPLTEPGKRFVALAEQHAADFFPRAERHDREASFPAENFHEMQASGFLSAAAASELGGLGLSSVHDLTVGLSRLGRGDGSSAIAASMHVSAGWSLGRAWRGLRATGANPTSLEALLERIARNRELICASGTE